MISMDINRLKGPNISSMPKPIPNNETHPTSFQTHPEVTQSSAEAGGWDEITDLPARFLQCRPSWPAVPQTKLQIESKPPKPRRLEHVGTIPSIAW